MLPIAAIHRFHSFPPIGWSIRNARCCQSALPFRRRVDILHHAWSPAPKLADVLSVSRRQTSCKRISALRLVLTTDLACNYGTFLVATPDTICFINARAARISVSARTWKRKHHASWTASSSGMLIWLTRGHDHPTLWLGPQCDTTEGSVHRQFGLGRHGNDR